MPVYFKSRTATFLFKIFILCAFSLFFSLNCCTKKDDKTTGEKWLNLFNGKNLDGWQIKFSGHEVGENYKNTFRVEDGLLKVTYADYDTFDHVFGHIFYEKPFSNYLLRVEYRFTGEQASGGPEWAFRNNGVMIHSQSPESMRRDQNFPVSIEAQLLGGNGVDDRPTANVCTPGTNIVIDGELIRRHCINSSSKTYHGDQWVTMEIEVHGGGKTIHRVNGDIVFEYEQPQLDPDDADAQALIQQGKDLILKSGYIALQAESHPTEFRKITLRKLEEDRVKKIRNQINLKVINHEIN